MKKIILSVLTLAAAVLSFNACVEVYGDPDHYVTDPNYNGTFDYTFTLQKVLEKDPINVNGIDIIDELEGFETLYLKISYVDEKITALEFSEGQIPFTAYDYTLPTEKVSCYLDYDCYPNAIKTTADNKVIVYYKQGQFFLPFQLDCGEITYEYWFK